MCDLLLKNGYPVDEIVFCDTLLEFDTMYQYIEKLKEYFLMRYNKRITILKPKKTFEDWCFGVIEKPTAKRKGMIRGIPTKDGMCWWRRESKVYPIDRYLKEKYPNKKFTQYIGYTLGENRSVANDANTVYSYPLQDIFKMTEESCKQYLIKQDMENPLYRHFNRTGCGACPFQSDKSWYMVWKHYPEVWEWMKDIEYTLQELEDSGYAIVNKHWFMDCKTCNDMEKMFIKADMQGLLFDFSDDPIKDCFCKI